MLRGGCEHMQELKTLGRAYALAPDVALGADGVIHKPVLAVRDGKILSLTSADAYRPGIDGPEPVRLPGTAIMPGMLDIHHHIIEPFAKSLTCGEPAQLWRRFWLPMEAAATPRLCYIGAKWTFLEALRGGITTIVDHGLRDRALVDAIHRAADETGIRLVSSTGAYDAKNFEAASRTPDASSSIDNALRIAEQHIEDCKPFGRISPSIACGTVQSNSADMIKALSGFCADKNILFQIHANEHTLEVHASIEATGHRPIELLNKIGALGRTTLIAHATLITSDEVQMLRESDTAVAYNPVASMWKGNAVTPAFELLAAGIRVGLGSDATRNDGFRMLEAAETCQRLVYGLPKDDFSCGAGWSWVKAATSGGAAAALLGGQTGQLAPGLQADFLLLDRSGPEVSPSWDFEWELVRFYDRADIVATFADGRAVCIGGRSTLFDGPAFMNEVVEEGVQWAYDSRMLRLHGSSSQHRPGAPPRPGREFIERPS
jgi:5-methylthioadenosine/S-adenosylhomocysteine deaminase